MNLSLECIWNISMFSFQFLFIIHFFNDYPSICASSSSTLSTCHGTFHTMLLAATPRRTAVSCTVAADDFQKISWSGCYVSENWKVPWVRMDPSPWIYLKVTEVILPLTDLQENPVAMILGRCTCWWKTSWLHFVQTLCHFFTVLWKAQSVRRVFSFSIVQSHKSFFSSWGNFLMIWDREVKDIGSLLQSNTQVELFQNGTFTNAKDSGCSVTA